jgi:hypothetical protein
MLIDAGARAHAPVIFQSKVSTAYMICPDWYQCCLTQYKLYQVHQLGSLQGRTTPLHIASERGHMDAVKLLLHHGADLDAVNEVRILPCL